MRCEMGVQIPNGHGQASQEWLLDGAPHPFMVVTGHAFGPTGTVQDFADSVHASWATFFGAPSTRSPNVRLGRTRVLYRNNAGMLEAAENGTIITGTGVLNPAPPPQVCILGQKRTLFAGRQYRGRMYIPGFILNEGNIDSAGIIDSATRGVVQGWINTWLSGLNASQYPVKLLHESLAIAPTAVTSINIDSRVATQRRRLRG
ncbi:MAG: hypothetical protein [Circular genetic element sp.]|nr:MAG: hypothetical protein [Circular genetic element sp.]